MKPVAHLAHVRELEQALADEYISLSQLMYAAGTSLADRVLDVLSNQASVDLRPVVIFAGTGNNGGDGWVAAEALAQEGVEVTVVTACDPATLTAQPAAMMAKHALLSQITFVINPSPQEISDLLIKAGVVVDAILGAGFEPAEGKPAIREPYHTWIHLINRHSSTYVVSVDVPSGVNAQTGDVSDVFVKADETLTMLAYKPGLLEPRTGEQAAGQVHLAPLFDPSHLVNRYEEYLASVACTSTEQSDMRDGTDETSLDNTGDEATETSDSQGNDFLGFTSSFTLDIFGRKKRLESKDSACQTEGAQGEIGVEMADDVRAVQPSEHHVKSSHTLVTTECEDTQPSGEDCIEQQDVYHSDVQSHAPQTPSESIPTNEFSPALEPGTDRSINEHNTAEPWSISAPETLELSKRVHQDQVAQAQDLMRRHTCARVLDLEDYAGLLPPLCADTNKYVRGHLYVVGGSHAYPGAAVLAARAAEQSGAGYVRVVAEEPAVLQHHLISTPVESWPSIQHLSEGHLTQWMERLNRAHALVLGPGLGSGSSASYRLAEQLVRLVVSKTALPLVIDADALNILAYLTKGSPSDLGMLLAKIPSSVILTPHAGEFGRMMSARISNQPSAARPHSLAQRIEDLTMLLQIFIRAGAINTTVVYKGDRTLVGYAALPHDQAKIYTPVIDLPDPGPPSLARAGTGDVLAGIIGSLIAQANAASQRQNKPLTSQDCASLASLAVYAHGEAAWRAFDALSSHRSVTPVDICDVLGVSLDTIEQEACVAAQRTMHQDCAQTAAPRLFDHDTAQIAQQRFLDRGGADVAEQQMLDELTTDR